MPAGHENAERAHRAYLLIPNAAQSEVQLWPPRSESRSATQDPGGFGRLGLRAVSRTPETVEKRNQEVRSAPGTPLRHRGSPCHRSVPLVALRKPQLFPCDISLHIRTRALVTGHIRAPEGYRSSLPPAATEGSCLASRGKLPYPFPISHL